jgi:prefoldin subunit 5
MSYQRSLDLTKQHERDQRQIEDLKRINEELRAEIAEARKALKAFDAAKREGER